MDQTTYIVEENRNRIRKKRRRKWRRRIVFLLILGFVSFYLTNTSKGMLMLEELRQVTPVHIQYFISKLGIYFKEIGPLLREFIADKLDYIANFL